jgi:hypothetical protein
LWSKEFQNLDRPAQQIARLKDILAELGMGSGRMSLEKAREIKERRELAQELGECLPICGCVVSLFLRGLARVCRGCEELREVDRRWAWG